jgi:hypothetical protein
MKKQIELAKSVDNEDQLILKSWNNEKLSSNDMRSIRGGDGEDNGGVDIIIIPDILKPKP